jgi:hypothetical protein
MNSKLFSLLTIAVAFLIYSPESTTQSRDTTSRPAKTRTILDEATDRARTYFYERFTKCGDSLLTSEWSDIVRVYTVHEFKQGNLAFYSARPVSNAERLNGIEWKGEFHLTATAQRYRNQKGTWQPWEDFDGRLTRWFFEVIKTNARWEVEPNSYSNWNNFTKVNCYISNSGEIIVRDPNDLSETYGYLKPYIFNKKTLVIFTTPEEFFKDSRRTSFTGLKYDEVTHLPRGLHYVDGRALTATDYARIEREQ